MKLSPALPILCCLLAGLSQITRPESASDEPILVQGRVLDAEGIGLPGVAVSLGSAIQTARTDTFGRSRGRCP